MKIDNFNLELDQYFLTDKDKIDEIVKALKLKETDTFAELGAGIGSITSRINVKCGITLIDIDSNLIEQLKINFPNYSVIEIDAIDYLKENNCNKILANLPWFLSDKLFETLKNKKFDIACVVIDNKFDYHKYDNDFNITKVCDVEADKYNYPPPFDSIYLKITKK